MGVTGRSSSASGQRRVWSGLFTVGLLATLLTACDGPAQPPAASGSTRTSDRAHATTVDASAAGRTDDEPLLYVTGNTNFGALLVYPQSGSAKPIQELPVNGAFGIAVAQNGDVYATNYSYQIEVFHHGATTPYLTLDAKHGGPGFLTLDEARSILYVSEDFGAIDVYPPGATEPLETLHATLGDTLVGMAVDSCGGLFVIGFYGNFEEFEFGSTQPVTLATQFSPDSYGLTFDAQNNAILLYDGGGSGGEETTLSIYAPPYSGPPAEQRIYKNAYFDSAAFNADGTELWLLAARPPRAQALSYPGLRLLHVTAGRRTGGYASELAAYPARRVPQTSPAATCAGQAPSGA